ncbi:hypothetical protein ACFQE8_11195 [Salinirubellus sp. GCM10025818]|uniref:hypothetical protein n=1 Tax=Salinirubellus TaxID=2162630 RepID=UPI0030CEB525
MTVLVGWALIGIIALGAAGSLLTGAVLWGLFSLVVLAVAVLPALTERDWTATAPWPLLLVAAVAVIARAAGRYAEAAGYLGIVALALVIVVELEAFTPVELSRWFAVAFAVMTALALQSLWIIAQFYSDLWLGTGFLSTQTELQEDIVLVTAVAVAVGGLFYLFFARFERTGTLSSDRTRTS